MVVIAHKIVSKEDEIDIQMVDPFTNPLFERTDYLL